MRRTTIVAVVSAVVVAAVNGRTQDRRLALIHSTVIDATGRAAQADMTVLMSGDRIVTVGKTATDTYTRRR